MDVFLCLVGSLTSSACKRASCGLLLALMVTACDSKTTSPTPTSTPTTPTPTTTPTVPTNNAPVIVGLFVTPAFGVAGVTPFTLNGAASDADSDPLTYAWSFGGGTATGQSATTTLTGDGASTVQLTVSDGRGGTVTGSNKVTVGTMTGRWAFVVSRICGEAPGTPAIFVLTQTGTAINGDVQFPGAFCNIPVGTHGAIPPSTPGSIDDQGNVAFNRIAAGNFLDIRIARAKMDATGRLVTGQVYNSGFNGDSFTLTKQ